jgi:hypothetical protein
MEQDNYLYQVVGKTVKTIHLIDFEEELKSNDYSPWQVLIGFEEFDKFLNFEDAYDGDHIRIDLDASSIDDKLSTLTEPNLWKPYQPSLEDLTDRLLGKEVTQIFYAKEKKEYVLNGEVFTGDQSLYSGLKIICDDDRLMIFSNGVGLSVEVNTDVEPYHKETYDWFSIM